MAKNDKKNALRTVGNIYLTGFMCSGKTSSGRALARALGRPFRDSDLSIERETGKKIGALMAKEGLRGFRGIEAAQVRRFSEGSGKVIALGGGIYPSRRWKKLLGNSGTVVFISCPWSELEKRLKASRAARPLLKGPWEQARRRAKELYSARLRFYQRADITVNASDLPPDRVAVKIAAALRGKAGKGL